MDSSLPAAIRRAREAAGMQAKDLATAVGVSASTMSLIESGDRTLKASELVSIARSLGISPLALIEPDSLVGQVSIAARTTETVYASASSLLRRVQGIAEVASLLPELPGPMNPPGFAWSSKPDADLNDWLSSARQLATWALASDDGDELAGDTFTNTANYIQFALGVNVIVEHFEDKVIGGAIVNEKLPLIVINSAQGRQRALFTLAHELGHILASDGRQVASDLDFRSNNASERFANAFAAEFLLPLKKVQRLLDGITDVRVAVGRLMIFGVSKQTGIYRLHNLSIINAPQRDALMGLHWTDFADADDDPRTKQLLLTRSDELAPRVVTPVGLLSRLIAGYRRGDVSAAPIAGILGVDIDDVIDHYGFEPEYELESGVDMRSSSPSIGDEAAYDGVPA